MLFVRRTLCMQEGTPFAGVRELAHVDEALGRHVLENVRRAPVDRHRSGKKTVEEFFRHPSLQDAVFKAERVPVVPPARGSGQIRLGLLRNARETRKAGHHVVGCLMVGPLRGEPDG